MNKRFKNLTGLIILLIGFTQFSVHAQDSLDMQKIEQGIDKYMQYLSENNPGAVVTVMKKGDILFKKAYGLSNVQTQEKMSNDKLFNLGELSKSFTALAIMQLVEKKKLNLTDKLKDIFPDFPEYGKTITVDHLLNHKSGLSTYPAEGVKTNAEVYDFLIKQNESIFEAGIKVAYSNSDYALLVNIIEKISGMSYPDFLRKNIFNKLEMNSTYFSNEISNENIAQSHFKENKEYVLRTELSSVYGNQGIFTTSIDFGKYDKALYSNKLLNCEGLTRIFKIGKLSNAENKSVYNCGWALMAKGGVRYFWQGGMQGGYTNLVLHLPDTQTTVLVFTNRNDGQGFLKMSISIAKLFDPDLKL